MCRHLSTIVRLSVDRFATVGPDPSKYASTDQKREILETGVTPEGNPAPPGVEVPDGLDDHEAAKGLRAAIAHFAASPGPGTDHPRPGPLRRAGWERFHCHHAAHHFSFAVSSEG
jgi:hypothetical protein